MVKKTIKAGIIFIFLSCNREESTDTTSFIQNNSGHSISIRPYYQGELAQEDTHTIEVLENKLILNRSIRGKGAGFNYPIYISLFDSTLITFDDTIKIMHYSYYATNLGLASIGLPYSNKRSIYNVDNYTRRIVSEKKHSLSNEYTFTFTDQDYLNAKEK